MCYNVLNYPEGTIINRADTLNKIVDYYAPDLLLLQELKSEQGLDVIVDEFNLLFGNYQAGTYVPQVSNPSNSWRLQQNIVYNATTFNLDYEEVIETPYRDINYFQLRLLKDDGSTSTEVIHTYVTHLKSSLGFSNEQLRLSMVNVLFDHIAKLPPDSKIVVGGDFNVYSSQEPAYEKLLETNGSNTLLDPIDEPDWATSGFSNRAIYTQSTRLNSLSDGAGGGMDDRFDFILLSDALMNLNNDLSYQVDSYYALGNNGTCYNRDLLDCTTTDNVPQDIISALYYMSDHLPVVLTLDVKALISSNKPDLSENYNDLQIFPNPANDIVTISSNTNSPLSVQILNMQGQTVFRNSKTEENLKLDVTGLSKGLYIIRQIDTKGHVKTRKLIIQR